MNTRKAAFKVISITSKVVILGLVFLAIWHLGKEAYYYGRGVFYPEPMDVEPGSYMLVKVAEQDTVKDIAKHLEKRGLVEDWKLFYLQARLGEYYEDVLPGEYILSTAMLPEEMMEIMSTEVPAEEEI